MSKKSKDKIRMMRDFIIQQIKETDWVQTNDGVKNNLFSIKSDYNRVNIIYFNTGEELYLNDFIGAIYFCILYLIYIAPSIKRYEKNKNYETISRSIDSILIKNKDIKRDSKIDEILNR